MKKYISMIILVVLAGSHYRGYSQERPPEWIPFRWQGDSISGRYLDKAYMYVPVKIEDLSVDFTMQLDLGTTRTLFYKPISLYLRQSSALAGKLDTVHMANVGVVKDAIFRDVDLRLGSVEFSSDVWNTTLAGTPEHIGTIAPDLFRDKIVVIDYPSCRLAVSDVLPAEYADLPAVPFELSEGIIILPLLIDGTERKVMFDTGSSPFALATSKERASAIAAPAIVDSLSGPLWWGQNITFYGLETNKPVELAGMTLENATVYYDKDGLWEEGVFKPRRIWGLTGNTYFLDCIIILDYKKMSFRIKRH
jgi:hypothetical protein